VTSRTVTLDMIDLMLRVSAASIGAGEYPPNTNAGPYVKVVLAATGNKEGDPWCASQFNRWGKLALGDAWPVPMSASVMAVSAWAEREKVRYVPSTGEHRARVGDGYVMWNKKLGRWAHIGLVVKVDDANPLRVFVRDGNTALPHDENAATAREGWLVAEKWRTLTDKDRLIRWVDAVR
jgi:hypothetical protein